QDNRHEQRLDIFAHRGALVFAHIDDGRPRYSGGFRQVFGHFTLSIMVRSPGHFLPSMMRLPMVAADCDCHCNWVSACSAANCSASFLVVPAPVALARPGTLTSTQKIFR